MSRRRKKLAVACATLVLCALLGWLASMVLRSRALYDASKGGARGWRGSLYRSDPELGLAPIPGAHADEVLAPLPDVPSRIDSRGFRVPLDAPDAAPLVQPIFLALGCSVTFGSCVRAEETFAFRVAQHFGGTCLNAGVCSGGAAQQLLLARELIPEYRPDYVLLQCSPWLIERSRTPYAPTFVGTITVPYFVMTPTGVAIERPLFAAKAFDVPIHAYRSSARGFGDFLGFLGKVGLPLLVHDDVCSAWTSVRLAAGTLPEVATVEEVEAYLYPELARLCAENGARLVAVAVETRWQYWTAPESLKALGIPIAHGAERMRALLPELTPKAYKLRYLHVAGDPPVLIDPHPNALAHSVIADEVVRVLERMN